MMFKIVSLFLVGMVVLAMFGRLRVPRIREIAKKKLSRNHCKSCGAPRVGKSPCPCGTGGKGGRGRGS